LDETERGYEMKKKLTLTVLLLLLTGCVSTQGNEPAPPTPTNELAGAPLPETTTTLPDLSFLNTTTTQPKPKPRPVTIQPQTGEPTAEQWDALAYCESSNRHDYPPVKGGFSGLLMFHHATWNGYGGQEYAPQAWQASREQQIEIALRLWRARGWQPWPGCRAKLGFN
jgi:hypothetical protein